ncbi:MAG: LysE family translocator [Alphaproteobacteria bacterium]|nr:LysE family translocator [Alphaproteobacteria bacterium]MCY4497611.1 LysE family translocator [Rhodospirillaceae bacterium]
MTLEQLFGFSVFAFVACATPGPNNVLLTAVGGSRGIRRGLPTLMGVAGGFALMLFLVAIGVGRTALALDGFSGTVRWFGAAFLLWLAWNIASAPVADAGASGNAVAKQRDGTGFVGAAFFQWINPKAWLVCVGAISTYLSPGEGLVVQATTFATVFLIAGFAGSFPWLAFGSFIRRVLRGPGHARAFNVVMAVLLVMAMIPAVLTEVVA